jgi:hypothetical protein
MDREERHQQLLNDAVRLNNESINRGDGPISARALAREMHISQDTARVLIKEQPERKPSPAAAQRDSERADAALRAPAQVHPESAPPGRPSAPEAIPPSALASAPSAPAPAQPNRRETERDAHDDADSSAPGGALPAQRPAPVEHTNGASIDAP